MASLFGSVASEVGTGMIENAKATREQQEAAAERLHQQQLINMRLQNERNLQKQRLDSEVKRDQRRREFDAMTQDLEMKSRKDEYTAQIANAQKITRMNNETDVLQSLIALQGKTYSLRSASAGSGAYDLNFGSEEGGFGVDGEEPRTWWVDVTGKGPLSNKYEIKGDKLIPVGGTKPPDDFEGQIDMQRATEDALLEGLMSDRDFYDRHGYLPKAYVFRGMTRDNADIARVVEENRAALPLLFNEIRQSWPTTPESTEPVKAPESTIPEPTPAPESAPEPAPELPPEPAPEPTASTGGVLEQGATGKNPIEAFQGWRDAKSMVQTKPWIKSSAARERMGLPDLSEDDAADIAMNIAADMGGSF